MNSPERVERTEICIIGTGAAGGILAYRLAMAGRSVLSLEQGAEIRDDYFTNGNSPEQDEHFGVASDKPWPQLSTDAYLHINTPASRLYARGDTTSTVVDGAGGFDNIQIFRPNGKQNLWGGVSLRLSPRDFRPLDIGEGGVNWPITYEDLSRHYTEVERLIGVCGTREGIADLPDGEFLPPFRCARSMSSFVGLWQRFETSLSLLSQRVRRSRHDRTRQMSVGNADIVCLGAVQEASTSFRAGCCRRF